MIAVRRARQDDAAGILHCLRSAFAPYRGDYTEDALHDTILDTWLLRDRMDVMTVFVAESDGRITGTVAAECAGGGDGHMRGMAVLPDAQGSGIGRRLLRRAIDDLTVSGCSRVTLDTTAPLVRAAGFYEAAGFQRTGRVGDFFGMPLHEFSAAIDRAFEFRDAGPDDADAIRRIVNAAYVVERDFVTGERLGDEELRGCLERGTFLVACGRDGRPLASVFLRPEPERCTYLGLLAVDPAFQGRGLGGLMMGAAERWCHRRGDTAIDIRVVNLRTELPPFYRARGFVEAGTAPFEDARLFKPAHFIVMRLPL
jgi:GNAT superfamily N-acetyltransferase